MRLRDGRSRTCDQQVSQLPDMLVHYDVEAWLSAPCEACQLSASTTFASCTAWQPVSTAADDRQGCLHFICSICFSLPMPQRVCGHLPTGQSGSPMYQNSAPATSSSQWDTESPTNAAAAPAAQAQRPGSGSMASADPFAASVSHLHGPACCALPERLPALPSQEASMA